MKKVSLSLVALLLALSAFCGAPQGINYQAIALNSKGLPFKSKAISLRLSILDGSVVGPIVYQEKQSPTTDNNGLISIQVGMGSTLSGTFATLDWSKGVYFLKSEIDTNGGNTFASLGTSQFFSVPYAFYSDKSGQANLASPEFPDGLNNITPFRMDSAFSYVVPIGKTLYITQVAHNGSTTCTDYGAVIDGIFVTSTTVAGTTSGTGTGSVGSGAATNRYMIDNPIVVPEGKAINSNSCGTSMVGFTINKNYSWVLFDLNTGNYTVPAGKVLVIKNIISTSASGWNGYYSVAGLTTAYNKNVSFADQNQTISPSGLTGPLLLMGYLKNR